jgi:NTP pyrophosphatase (non-canonical NTP hydrolase)
MSDTMFSLATAIVEEVAMAVDAAEGRNPFDPRCSPEMLVARMAALVGECADKAGSHEWPISSRYFEQHLTELVAAIVDDRRNVIASNAFCVVPSDSTIQVEHCESQLLVSAHLAPGSEYVRGVVAKSYPRREMRVCQHPTPRGPVWRR